MKVKRFECSACGRAAYAYKQWWNRDKGFGLCSDCAAWLRSCRDYKPDEFAQNYGREGEHWFTSDGLVKARAIVLAGRT